MKAKKEIKLSLKLKWEFEHMLKNCDEIWIAAAMISESGMQFIQKHINEDSQQHYIVGVGLPTPPSVLQLLKHKFSDGTFEARVANKPESLFHPKVYLFRINDRITAFVGSANCTMGGFEVNTEVTLRTDDVQTCQELLVWFDATYRKAHEITDSFIEKYSRIFQGRMDRIEEDKSDIDMLFQEEGTNMGIEKIDFTHQFFKREHFGAFEGNKPFSHSPEVDSEREKVRTRLFILENKISPLIKSKGWDIHRHYSYQDTVSSATHGTRTSSELGGMWLHYGRTQEEIKNYGKDETPLNYMRMQVIIHKDHIGIWNRIGKKDGSRFDRENLRNNLKIEAYRNKLYGAVINLADEYYISLGDETLYIHQIKDEMQLTEFLLKDDYKDFFTIGIDLSPDDQRLSETNITDTIIENFSLLLPTYQLIKHTMEIIK